MEKENMIFELSGKIKYSKDGDFLETATLEFPAPTMDTFEECSDLSQLVMNAMMDAAKHAPQQEEKEPDVNMKISADEIKAVFFSARDVKFTDIAKCFEKLALKIGTVDGQEKITGKIIKSLGPEDYTRLICEYVANFIVPSLV
jgi:hypothetical protein